MAKANQHYPDSLNPFGSDEEDEKEGQIGAIIRENDYPDYLSPFKDDGNGAIDDYDSSLNPFGDEEETAKHITSITSTNIPSSNQYHSYKSNYINDDDDLGEGNPFADEEDENESPAPLPKKIPNLQQNVTVASTANANSTTSLDKDLTGSDNGIHLSSTSKPNSEHQSSTAHTPQPDSLETPPVPLPRTKSLLKKEQKMRQQQQLVLETNRASSLSITSSNSLSSINTATTITTATNNSQNSQALTATNSTGSFQRKKNKRNAPPVPINFKRQVSGSLDAIEEELNDIGDKLAIIERESNVCQETLKSSEEVDGREFAMTRNKFIELIKRKNSIVRRQKELMYRKRELKLDQIHSDIEYELRMIGNKQLSHRTSEDEAREKELLKKLVEIVEEKSDIVENLNKDSSCDSHDIEEALRRLNITAPSKSQPHKSNDDKEVKKSSILSMDNLLTKKRDCDKSSIAKLSKIATLLPNGGTIKGTMKLKRKQLFKKSCDSRPVEHK